MVRYTTETERSDYPADTQRTSRSDMPATQRGDIPTQRTGFSSHYDDVDEEFESVSQISGDQPVSILFSFANHSVLKKLIY